MVAQLQDMAVRSGEHVVQFYERDTDLERSLGRYLAAAVHQGAVVIAIATAAHLPGLEAEMSARGLDLVASAADGRLVLLDAAETLAAFTDEATVNHERFDAVVGSVVRRAAATGRPVCAFGEMVAVLWERGDVLGAIELERAWNELARDVPFMLICGYRSESVRGHEHAGPLAEVCCLHTAVLDEPGRQDAAAEPPVELSAEFAAERDAPARARHFVTDALRRWGHEGKLLNDARLVVTELATNAVIHAESSFTLQVELRGERVRLAVSDGSPRPVLLRDPQVFSTSGRGVRMVADLAEAWGVDSNRAGKTVWVQLRRSPQPALS